MFTGFFQSLWHKWASIEHWNDFSGKFEARNEVDVLKLDPVEGFVLEKAADVTQNVVYF